MAAASIASTGIVHEVLTKDNYENWSALVQNYLVGQRLWHDVVEGDSKLDVNDPDWRSKNAMALHAIQLSCGSETLGHIRIFKTAKEAWNHLKASFSEDVKAYPDIEEGRDQYIYRLHSDVKRGYWNDAKSYINRYPDAVFSSSHSTGRTVLHVAVAAGQERIVKELVKMGNQRFLKMQDKGGYTALALAAELTGNKKMAEWMVSKGGEDLLTMKTKEDGEEGEIPVLLASAKGHKQMTSYLFSKTPYSVLFENSGHYGAVLLSRCISAEIFDVAAALLQHRDARVLPLTNESEGLQPIYLLARMPSAFLSGSQLGWRRGFIYNILRLQTYTDPKGNSIQMVSHIVQDEGPDTNTLAGKICKLVSILVPLKHLGRFLEQFQQVVQTSILLKFSGIKELYEMKINHYLVNEILKCLSKRISRLDESNLRACSAYDAMLQAAKYGIIEFINSMRIANPDLLWAMDKNKRGIFSHAILNHQEKVFELVHEMKGQKSIIASHKDVYGNNMLHLAAELGPSSDLGRRSNAALQMQRELQWFMDVERIVPPICKEARNAFGKKPGELFTKNHEELVKAGDKWAKDAASSFTLVGTLIVTIMFAAAFTVPGGNYQDTGIPTFLGKDAFTVFIISDALSLITSSSSVLIFVGILKSRYVEKDFLTNLPVMLLLGLITIFLCVTSMMCAFVAALYMMLKGYRWVVIAVTLLAVITLFVIGPSHLRLSLEIFNSTMRFDLLTDKKKKIRD